MAQDPESWRVGFDVAITRGLNGGHAETKGVSENREVITVAEHRHEVEIDIYRYELSASRTLNDSLDFAFRLPYFVKDQTAEVVIAPGTSDADRDAAIRNGQIHHRDETYSGVGDGEISLGWRGYGLFWDTARYRVSAGVTLPFGETEDDPWILGDQGLKHLHLQFGNGTFDPIIDAYYGVPINDHWGWSIYGKARIPLYHNDKGYRGSNEFSFNPRIMYLATKKGSVHAGISNTYFGKSDWEETGRDRNSGLFAMYASFGGGYKIADFTTASIATQLPIYTDVFGDEDGLETTPVFSFSLSQQF